MSEADEVNFDGLAGPTHHFGGLAIGNLASRENRLKVSHPREAALQGIRKMKQLHDLGCLQGIFPPHERPHIPTLRRLGFRGSDSQVLEQAAKTAPALLAACSSASGMWLANAATVCPSADAADHRVHFTPANLVSQLHRSIETAFTARVLKRLFPDPEIFVHHPPLPATWTLGDEGAANHTRLCHHYAEPGIQLFVWGRSQDQPGNPTRRFPARQTAEASDAIARLHRLPDSRVLQARQNPEAVDAGAFHNDVVAVGNRDLLLCHTEAYCDQASLVKRLQELFRRKTGHSLTVISFCPAELPLADAIASYFFNSQLVTTARHRQLLIAPIECWENPRARACIERVTSDASPVETVYPVDLRESMKNGGGPACVRLRVVLTAEEQKRLHPRAWFDSGMGDQLFAWIEKHYREELDLNDLRDPQLLEESRVALDRLTQLLDLGSVYDFQQGP